MLLGETPFSAAKKNTLTRFPLHNVPDVSDRLVAVIYAAEKLIRMFRR